MMRTLLKSLSRRRFSVERTPAPALLILVLFHVSPSLASDFEMAHSLVLKKSWTEALPLLETLHREAPNSTLIAADLAQTLLRVNRRAEAIRLLRRIGNPKQAQNAGRTFIHQENFRLYQEGVNFLEGDKYALARDRLEKALDRDRDHLEILIRLVQVETLDLRPDAALKWIRIYREHHDETAEFQLWEGRVLHLQRKFPEAVQKLKIVSEKLPRSQNAALFLSQAFYENRESEAARLQLARHLQAHPLHLRARVQKIRWDFESQNLPADFSSMAQDLQELQGRLNQLSEKAPPRFESELGVDGFDLEQLKNELTLLQSRLEELKKRAAL